MKTPGFDKVQEPKSETLENTTTYRAPRLVPLGTAEGLVQISIAGNVFDTMTGTGRETKR